MRSIGLYGQDQWTLDRLTVNAGLRFDYFRTGYPDHDLQETLYGPAAFFEGQDVATWKDLSPRLGVVYDLFGNGRTALKLSASRYVDGIGTTLASQVNPALQNDGSLRGWLDGDRIGRICFSPDGVLDIGYLLGGPTSFGCIPGDDIPQGDPTNVSPNGELVTRGDVNFGTAVLDTTFDPDWAFGWGNRFANWEFSGGIQHELADGLSVNVSYFRRIFTNFRSTNNRLQNPEDFDPYCVTVRVDPRLPGGGGNELCGLYEVTPEKDGLQDSVWTFSDNFGKEQRHWNGVDVTMNARMDNGLLLQGGLSTGSTKFDDCDVRANLNNPGDPFCSSKTPFLTQVKFLGSYTLPYDIQIAATYQSLPGREIRSRMAFTFAEISASLGRPSSVGLGNTRTIDVVERRTEYSERLNQFDLRLTKIFTLGTSRLRAMFDLYNLFNDSTPLELNRQYGLTGENWQAPQLIVPGRLLKFAFQLDF